MYMYKIETKPESFKFLTWQIETRSASPLLTPTTWAQTESPMLMIRSGIKDTNDLEDNIDAGDFDSDGDEGDGDLLSWQLQPNDMAPCQWSLKSL